MSESATVAKALAAGAELVPEATVEAADARELASGEVWTLDADEAKELAAKALARDPERAARWVALANRGGVGLVDRLLNGGLVGIQGLEDAERVIDARLKREASTAWMDPSHASQAPRERQRQALVEVVDKGSGSPYLPGGLVGIVVGGGGNGKSSWVAELAMRLAWADMVGDATMTVPPLRMRTPDARMDTGRAHARVLLFLAEEDREGADAIVLRGLRRVVGDAAATVARSTQWAERVRVHAGAEHDTALAVLVQTDDPLRGRVTSFAPSRAAEELMRQARDLGPLLVVLDPVAQILPAGGNENDAATATAVLKVAAEIRSAAEEGVRRRWSEDRGRDPGDYNGPRPVVLLVHHEAKAARLNEEAGAGAARGSGAWTDNARWVLRMFSEGAETTTWRVEKSNYGRPWEHKGQRVSGGELAWEPVKAEDKPTNTAGGPGRAEVQQPRGARVDDPLAGFRR